MMPPFNFVFPTNRIAHFVEVSLYYLAQEVNIGLSVIRTLLCFLIPGLNPFTTMVSSGTDGSVITQTSLGGNELALMGFSLAWDLVFAVLFFLGSRYILSKKLNLE